MKIIKMSDNHIRFLLYLLEEDLKQHQNDKDYIDKIIKELKESEDLKDGN